MSDNPGVHAQLTADSSSFVTAINNAKNKLIDLKEQTKLLKDSQVEIASQLEKAKKKYGENSTQVKRLKTDLADNARAQKDLAKEVKKTNSEIEKATKGLKKYAEEAAKNTNSAVDSVKNGFNIIKGIIAGYAGKKLYEVLIGTNADYEQSLTSLEVMLQSTSKAQKMMDDIEKFSSTTPLKNEDVQKATELLLSYGEAEQNVMTRLQQLGDVSRGNAEKFGRVTLAYGQMVAKGKVTGEELRQMTEAGVPMLSALAKSMNITTAALSDMISDGKVGIPELNKALEDMTGAGGQFFGMMDKQSKTFSGMLSTLSDNAAIYSRKIGEESFKYLEQEAGKLLNTINELNESGKGDRLAETIGKDIANVVVNIVNLIKWMYEMRTVIITVAGAWAGFKVSMSIAGTINSVIIAFHTYTTTLKTVKTASDAATIANDALKGSLVATPWGAIAAVIGIVAGALVTYALQAKTANDATKELTAEQEALNSTEVVQAEKLKVAKNRLYELEDQMKSGKLTTEQATKAKKEMNSIVQNLNNEIPNLKLSIDSETGALSRQRSEVDNLTNSYYKMAYAKAMAAAYQSKFDSIAKKIVDKEDKIKKNQEKASEIRKDGSTKVVKVGKARSGATVVDDTNEKLEKLHEKNYALFDDIEDLKAEMTDTYEEMNKQLLDYEKFVGIVGGKNDPPGKYTPSPGGSPTSSGGKSSTTPRGKTQAEIDLEEFKKKYEESLEYIELHNMLDDWHTIVMDDGTVDSEVAAYKRMAAYTAAAHNNGKIDDDYYEKTVKELFKKQYTAQRDEYTSRFQDSLDYIEKNNKYGTWGDDNVFQAIYRIQQYTDEARRNKLIDDKTYVANLGKVQELLESEISTIIENESEKRKQTYQNEFDLEKQLIEDRLELRKAEYKKQSEYLDKLVEKRKRAKEDEDYATKMERLKLKLEYETDDANKISLQKEIKKLQEQIDDTEFERDIERQRESLTKRQEQAEESAKKGIDLITDYYTAKMNDVNIAKEITANVDMGEYQKIGSMMGEWIASGIRLKIDGIVDGIVKTIKDLPSPQTFVTNNNNKTYELKTNIVASNTPSRRTIAKAAKKALSDIAFFEGN